MVLDEIALAPTAVAARIVREVNKLAPTALELSDKSEELAEAYLDAGVVPAKKRDDARHVAIATVAGLEIVVVEFKRTLLDRFQQIEISIVSYLVDII